MVRIPGVTKDGRVDKRHMVSVLDLLPTVLDALGVEKPSRLDGRSFYPILKGEKQADRDFIIKQYHENSGRSRDPMRAIQTKTHLYLFNPWSNGERIFATATNGTVTCKRMIELAKNDKAMNGVKEEGSERGGLEMPTLSTDESDAVGSARRGVFFFKRDPTSMGGGRGRAPGIGNGLFGDGEKPGGNRIE